MLDAELPARAPPCSKGSERIRPSFVPALVSPGLGPWDKARTCPASLASPQTPARPRPGWMGLNPGPGLGVGGGDPESSVHVGPVSCSEAVDSSENKLSWLLAEKLLMWELSRADGCVGGVPSTGYLWGPMQSQARSEQVWRSHASGLLGWGVR